MPTLDEYKAATEAKIADLTQRAAAAEQRAADAEKKSQDQEASLLSWFDGLLNPVQPAPRPETPPQ